MSQGLESVLPLTREWIEIAVPALMYTSKGTFSLLRGSGLKYHCLPPEDSPESSPSYEGVD